MCGKDDSVNDDKYLDISSSQPHIQPGKQSITNGKTYTEVAGVQKPIPNNVNGNNVPATTEPAPVTESKSATTHHTTTNAAIGQSNQSALTNHTDTTIQAISQQPKSQVTQIPVSDRSDAELNQIQQTTDSTPIQQSTTALKDAHKPENEPLLTVHGSSDSKATPAAIHASIEHIANDADVKAYSAQQQEQLHNIQQHTEQQQRNKNQANAHPAASKPVQPEIHHGMLYTI